MGDVHFILRHALTGIVLLGFMFVGWWIGDPQKNVFSDFVGDGKTVNLETAAASGTFIATIPLIGIAIQGVHIITLILRDRLFSDPARSLVANIFRREYESRHRKRLEVEGKASSDQTTKLGNLLRQAPDDAIFVWYYYSKSEEHLVEWARRRRSYYYLGVNLAIAALIGLAAGFSINFIGTLSVDRKIDVAVAGTLIWVACAFWLASKMKQDVESMELTWTVAQIATGFEQTITCSPLSSSPVEVQVERGASGSGNKKSAA